MEAWLLPLVMSVCRVGGCLLVMPGLSSARVPVQARLLTSIGIAVSVSALIPVIGVAVETWSDLFLMIGSELMIGVFIGLIGRLFLLSLSFMATAVATMIGFGNIAGPGIENGEPQAAIGTLVTMSSVIILFQMDFHHTIIEALADSYSVIRPFGTVDSGFMLDRIANVVSSGFLFVLQLAGPFVAYALIANLSIGLINKLAPQVPVYFVSLPFLIAGGLWFLYLSLPIMLTQFGAAFIELYR